LTVPRVRACIVSYRSPQRAAAACRSAAESNAEVALVNNFAGDGTAEAVRAACPAALIHEPARNLGFAAGSNLAARGAGTEYLLFLNPDATLEPGALNALLAHLDTHPEAGIVGPALCFSDGRSQPSVRRDPSAAAILHQYTAWGFTRLFCRAYRLYRAPRAAAGPVEVLMGSVLLVRTALFLELGGFDERYFMYYEEADLCRRARDRSAAVVFVPGATAIHEGGVSAGRGPSRLAAMRLVSAQRYVRKFESATTRAFFRPAFILGFPLRAAFDLIRDTVYAAAYAVLPGRRKKANKKLREALSALRLLTVDLPQVLRA